MNAIKKAIVLTAGLGSRLKPLTDEVPKCLTEVNGKPILEETLNILEKNGIRETLIVIGYLGEVTQEKIGTKYRNMHISYAYNEIYDETNSMYSAWLARSFLEDGAILIEGDTFFEERLISSVLEQEDGKSFWVADRFTREYEGSMSTTGDDERIVDVHIVRGQLAEYKDNYFKSTGIVKITPEYGKLFSQWLNDEVEKGNTNIYYDLVIAKHLKDAPVYIHDITGLKWAELDSLDDLKRVEKIFTPRKYVIIIIDGAADLPLEELEDKTPLDMAQIPNMDDLTKKGKTGLMRTMYPGLPVGSIVANMGILGYNPLRYYPHGRASFEALAQDIYMNEGDLAFRCNLVTVRDDILTDFTADNIDYQKAAHIISSLRVSDPKVEIYPGQGYRNILIMRDAHINANEIVAREPHMNIGKPISPLLLRGKTERARVITEKLNKTILESQGLIQSLNKELHTRADMIFLWSPSSEPRIPSFRGKYGVDGAIVAGLDFMRGIGIAARMEAKKIQGATGYSDTLLDQKLKYALNGLKYNDLVYLHINAPDEESHRKDFDKKIKIIERIDRELIGPLKEYLDTQYGKHYRIAVLPDHYTLLRNGEHSTQLVPYTIYGEGIKKDDVICFSEKSIGEKSKIIVKSYEFMDFLLRE